MLGAARFTDRQDLTDLTSHQAEAERLMTICNACRYCEGLCAVFPAMEFRREFPAGDLNYLANLCHNCGACYYDCQFATPHEFAVNVPQTLSDVRNESYAIYVWPPFLAGTFARNGLTISIVCALSVAVFLGGLMAFNDPSIMFGSHQGQGSFYRIMPHGAMVAIFGVAFLYSALAMAMGFRSFWRDISPRAFSSEVDTGSREENASNQKIRARSRFNQKRTRSSREGSLSWRSIWEATRDAGQLRYLDGGGAGCTHADDRPSDRRRLFHHMTFYGFLLCFASTSVATIYAYALGWQAPYEFYDLPVLLGTVGGIGLVAGPTGLLFEKSRRDPAMVGSSRQGMDVGFIAMLLMTSITGILLLLLRSTPAMASVLALHLGFVFGFFVTMPYGKFVHGFYRLGALIKFASERHQVKSSAESGAPV
jgi:citrate/tricarballylate utilization protein